MKVTIECPRYGDDCDGDKRVEHTDYISRADAIELLTKIVFDEPPYLDSESLCRIYAKEQINTLPSAEIAETEPTVIRSKTLMPTKDFKEWAKRVRETNPKVIVIPCDAEVVSADAVHGEWLEKYNGNGWNDFWDYTCSHCGKKYERADAVLYHANYCPNCGARNERRCEMTREEAIQWLKHINITDFGWDDYAMQDSQKEIRERCEQSIRKAIDMAIEALQREEAEEKGYCHRIRPSNVEVVVRCKDCRHRYEEGDCTHYYWCRLNDRPVDDTDYCAWGEESEVEEWTKKKQ